MKSNEEIRTLEPCAQPPVKSKDDVREIYQAINWAFNRHPGGATYELRGVEV